MYYVPISEMTLTYANFRRYWKDHPGPKTRKAYNVRKKNKGRDYPNFHWTEKKQKNNQKNYFIKKFIPRL